MSGKRLTVAEASDLWVNRSKAESPETVERYHHSRMVKIAFIFGCVVLAFVSVGLSVGLGPYDIGILNSYTIIWDHIAGNPTEQLTDFIVWEKRLPRALVGVIAGAGLAIGGCIMQAILKNPLADSYTTGISAGAGFGATLVFTLGISVADGTYTIIGNAFLFALIPTLVIVFISRKRGSSSIVMVMAGIAMMYFFDALAAILKLIADPHSLSALFVWQMGTLSGVGWENLPFLLAAVLFGGVVVELLSRKIDLLTTGDEYARSMGLNVSQTRNILLVLITVMISVIVSFTGIIGFVGLVAPHICRIFIGSESRYLIPASAAFGAFILTAADAIGKVINPPAEMQVGIIMAFLGAPMFLYLAMSKKRQVW